MTPAASDTSYLEREIGMVSLIMVTIQVCRPERVNLIVKDIPIGHNTTR